MEHPTGPLAYRDAIAYVEQFLDKHALTDDYRVRNGKSTIYDYFDRDESGLKERPWVGVRVSEVDFSFSEPGRSGGASYMQVDSPWGVAFCGQVERCILALVEGWNQHTSESDGVIYGEGDEEFGRLLVLIEAAAQVTPELPATEIT